MTAIETKDAMLHELWKNCQDWELRRLTADACEDAGDHDLAECLRWMVDNQKRSQSVEQVHYWYDINRIGCSGIDVSSDIPTEICNKLIYGRRGQGVFVYQSSQKAESDFYQAWIALRKEGVEL